MRALGLTMLALVMLGVMGGCSWVSGTIAVGDAEAGASIDKALESSERGVTKVDLSDVVHGDWSSVVIACHGTTQADLAAALGFEWDVEPGPGDVNFMALLAFVDDDGVETYFNVGQDDMFVDHWYFSPCSVQSDDAVIRLDRADATIEFTRRTGYWDVAPFEFARLTELSII